MKSRFRGRLSCLVKLCGTMRSRCLREWRLRGEPSSKRLGVLSRVDLDGVKVWVRAYKEQY